MAAKSKKKIRHPSLDIVESEGSELAGRRVVLCIAGSVAAYKAIELARMLMRHGGDVTCVLSGAAAKLIRPDYFKWATGNDTITSLSGNLEHVRLADYGQSDLIVVYPATANTLGKLANGIDDTPVSTVLTVGFGARIPIVLCPAMHEAMYNNAAVKKNIEFLKNRTAFVLPSIAEGKAKAPEPEDVLNYILKRFGHSQILSGRRVLMTAGPTVEHIDPVRVITNLSTGRTGVLLAAGMISAGARVTLVYGPGIQHPPRGARVIRVKTSREMAEAVGREMRKKFDIIIMAAAVADYIPENPSRKKIKSTSPKLALGLKRAPKIIEHVRKRQKTAFLVGFKAETGLSKASLIREARKTMVKTEADLIIANDVGSRRYLANPQCNEVIFVSSDSSRSSGWKKKEKIAKMMLEEIEKRYAKRGKPPRIGPREAASG